MVKRTGYLHNISFLGIVLAVMIMLQSTLINAQESTTGYVIVRGVVVEGRKKMNNAKVMLAEGNRNIEEKITAPNGKFMFKLDLRKDYLLTFSKDGYVTKKISFSTEVPGEENGIWEYKFSVELFEMIDGLDVSILDKPVSKIKYYDYSADFDYDNEYTKSMQKQLEQLMQQAESLKDNQFQQTIDKADQLYADEKYEEAIALYDEAIDINPFSEYPDEKIYEITTYLRKKEAIDEAYKRAIEEGDKNYNIQNYEAALSFYRRALDLKSIEEYPQNQIAEIEQIMAELNAMDDSTRQLEQDYKNAIANGDFAIEQEKYEEAKQSFNEALSIKPDEQYPRDQLVLVDELIAQKLIKEANKEEVEKAYLQAITEADEYFNSNNYMEANNFYEKALSYKPNEKYPKDKIAEINKIYQTQKAIEANYQEQITQADAYYKTNQYEKAKAFYKKALSLKPNEKYPKDQIISIDAYFASLKSMDEKYAFIISVADSLFNIQDYNNARPSYQEAAQLKPNQSYPKDQIAEIDRLLIAQKNAAEEEKRLNEEYEATLAKADNLFNTQNYSGAKVSYEMALELKPGETYPKDKIDEIEAILEREKELRRQYEKLLAGADKKFNAEDFEQSKAMYNEALALYPDEEYPKTRIAEIDLKLKALLSAEQLRLANDKEYARLIKAGDSLFNSENYNASKSQYEQALAIKANEKYPKNRIQEILDKLEEINKINAEYSSLIATADALFTATDYGSAIENYQKASALKPDETYPINRIDQANQKIAERERLLAAEQKLNEDYGNFINLADDAFKAENYSLAKSNYQNALNLKQNEPYPTNRIKEIDNILYDQMLTKKAYDDEITKADNYYNNKEYEFAQSSYEKALTIIEDQEYPKNKLAEIERLLEIEREKQKAYDNAIADADKYFNDEEFENAIESYNAALGFLPGEQYPRTRIEEINKIVENRRIAELERKQKEEGYNNAIASADAYFNQANYAEARTEYQKALSFKPEESYPKSKLLEIDDIIAKEQKERESNYNRAIASADSYLYQKKYDAAKSQYNKALTYMPNEEYPRQKLEEIDALILQEKAEAERLRQLEENYNKAITEGNTYFKRTDYVSAKASYQKALSFKPDASFPQKRLSDIEELIRQQQLAQAQAEEDKKQEQIDASKSSFKQDKDFDYSGEERKGDFLSELAKNYPEGKTVENYEKPNKKILRIILNNDGIAKEYIKVSYSYGTFYFRNGQNISQSIFNTETKD